MKTSLLLFLLWVAASNAIAPKPAASVAHTYEYQDSKIRQVVEVRFLTEKHVVYAIRFLNKKTGKICQTQGQAVWNDPTGNVALVEDDNGNSYGAVDFYSKAAPLYTNLSFEYPRNGKISTSHRLQVSVAAAAKDGCHFSSAHVLKRVN